MEDVISNLKRVYSLNKFVYQLQGELGNIYQWDNEKVISYATHVRELGQKMLEMLDQWRPQSSLPNQGTWIQQEKK